MPRPPTGNPRGRPKGTGRLTPAQTVEEAQTRVTVRLPTVLYDRLEAFAAGRSYHRGSPQLARCVREALEEYLDRHTNRQTENVTTPSVYINRQTESCAHIPDVVTRESEDKKRQTINEQIVLEQSREIISQPVIEQEESGTEPAKVLGAAIQENRQTKNGVPVYDTTKYTLGKLCPRGHDWQGTGKSFLRLTTHGCLACEREKAQTRRAAQQVTPKAAEQAPLLAQLATWRAAGMSFKAIAARLNTEGVPTVSGRGQWNPGTVLKLLRDAPEQAHGRRQTKRQV